MTRKSPAWVVMGDELAVLTVLGQHTDRPLTQRDDINRASRVDDLIEIVIHDGDWIAVADGALGEHQHIALVPKKLTRVGP